MKQHEETRSGNELEIYIQNCLDLDQGSDSLLGIFIAELNNSVNPKEVEKNIILIVKDKSESIWGNTENLSDAMKNLNIRCIAEYALPLGFPICENELFAPYPESRHMTPLILSLKRRSEKIHGGFDMDMVPDPSPGDILREDRKWKSWNSYLKGNSVDAAGIDVFMKMISDTLAVYLRTEKAIFEFDPKKIIPAYLTNDPPFADSGALLLAQDYLETGRFANANRKLIKLFAIELRTQIIPFLYEKYLDQNLTKT
jgi:hypothetical protein